MRRTFFVAVAFAVVGCAQPDEPPPIVGEKPLECDPPVTPGDRDDVTLATGPSTVILMPMPLIDPDCASTIVLQRSTTVVLTWSEASSTIVEAIPATLQSRWNRIGSECHARITIDHHGGPVGRAGSIRPCHADMRSDAWASFADVPIVLDSLSIEGADASLAGPIDWRGNTAASRCDQPPIESTALSLSVTADVRVSLANWRRLHSLTPPVLAIEVVVGVH